MFGRGVAPTLSLAPGSVGVVRGTGGTDELRCEAPLSRWWLVGIVGFAAVAVVSTVVGLVRLDVGWLALAATSAVTAAALLVAEGRQPREVAASTVGVEVVSRRRTLALPWEELRRVRGRNELGFPRVDTYLERDTGGLLALPRNTSYGAVEAWRTHLGGGRPAARLPQVWRLPLGDAGQHLSILPYLVMYSALLGVNLLADLVDLSLPGYAAAYLVTLWLLTSALSRLPAQAITADEHALTLAGWRRKRIPWSQVRDVRRKGRFDPQVVVELETGDEQDIFGPDQDVVRGWWRLAAPAGERPGRPGR